MVKNRAITTHKKAIISFFEETAQQGYLNPQKLGEQPIVEFLTRDGEYKSVEAKDLKAIYFVKEFTEAFEPDRKIFLSRPKIEGLWVRLRFRDDDEMEGLVPNDLVALLDKGIRLTPPDLHANTLWVFIPQTALTEMKVLGVVGVARRTQQAKAVATGSEAQPKLFGE